MKRKVLGVVLGVVFSLGFSVGLDRLMGVVLNRGYFKAFPPNVKIHINTNEFVSTANISSQGLRNKEVKIPKPNDAHRILVLGDSFVFGWGVDDNKTWVSRLQEMAKQQGSNVEYVNAGLPGAGPTQERYVCRAYADWFDVDEVWIALFSDDLYQAAAREERLSDLERLSDKFWPILERVNNRIIGDYYGDLKNKTSSEINLQDQWKSEAVASLKMNPGLLLKIDPSLRSDFLAGKMNSAIIAAPASDSEILNFVLNEEKWIFAIDSLKTRLARLKERCTKNLPVKVVYLPRASYVSSLYHDSKLKLGYQVDPRIASVDVDDVQEKLVTDVGFGYLSLVDNLRITDKGDLYYQLDGHLTELGNEVVANYLFERFDW